ncbi:hypothetical protein Aduo_011563 [Ancylostoma duodenale]
MTIIETFLVVLPLISFACHPGQPSQWKPSPSSRNRVVHDYSHGWQAGEGKSVKNPPNLKGTIIHGGKTAQPPKTSRIRGATTEMPSKLPECQQCTRPPQSDTSECKVVGCQPVETKVRIVDECSVAELNCPEGALSFGVRGVDGEHGDHGLDEIGIARCLSGVWKVETASGERSIGNIVCTI